MEMIQLGKTDLVVTRIALGCWQFGGDWWGGAQDEKSIATVHKALDIGINFFDTADVYGFGRSEKILAKALGTHRKDVIIATKVGVVGTSVDDLHIDLSRRHIIEGVEESLKKLNTDYIDLYQTHWPDNNVPIEETALALEDLVSSGKIRYIGASNVNVMHMQEYIKHYHLDAIQPRYNMIDRKVEKEVLPFCEKKQIGVLAYSPMHRGLLTGKITKDTKFAEGDNRGDDKEFKGEAFKKNLAIIEKLKHVATCQGKTLAQLAVAWVLMHPAVSAALWGARSPEQIEGSIDADGWRLSEEIMNQIEEIFQTTKT